MLIALMVVLGATEVHGQASTGVQAFEAVRVLPFVHGELGVAREFADVTLSARASVVLQIDPASTTLSGQDLGSAADFAWRVRRGWTFRATLIPLNANVLLPTTDWANRWGRATTPFSPALVFALEGPLGRAWLALRPSVEFTRPLRWQQGVLAGVASGNETGFRFDLRLAGLDYGQAMGADPLAAPSASRFALLADALVGWVWNEDVGPALDFSTYVTDPTRFTRFFDQEPSRHARALRLSLEGGVGSQWLPAASGELRAQAAGFVDLQARARVGPVRLFATGRVRTATQVNFDLARTVTDDGRTTPELSGFLGADVRIGDSGVRPGLMVRVLRNATPKVPDGAFEVNDVLPPSPGAAGFAVKASVTWLLANLGAVAGEFEAGTTGVRWLLLGQVRF
jgi:hypothetical protein